MPCGPVQRDLQERQLCVARCLQLQSGLHADIAQLDERLSGLSRQVRTCCNQLPNSLPGRIKPARLHQMCIRIRIACVSAGIQANRLSPSGPTFLSNVIRASKTVKLQETRESTSGLTIYSLICKVPSSLTREGRWS